MFIGKTKDNKQKGLGNIDNKPPINDPDLSELTTYFPDVFINKVNLLPRPSTKRKVTCHDKGNF